MKTKKLAAVLTAVCLFSSASAANIWQSEITKTVTRGVTLTHDTQFSQKGWVRAHVLTIDLENPNLDLVTLFDKDGIKNQRTIPSMAENAGVVAAVNADFFNWGETPLGFTVEDGRVISSPAHDTGLAALMQGEDGSVFAEYVQMKLMVTCPAGYTAQILHINKYHSMQSMVLYTKDWGAKTPGSHDGVSELVVQDGIVQEIRLNMEGTEVPENGYVLATSTKTSTYLVDNFQVGDKVELSYTITPDVGKIQTAVGGGTVLVKNGRRAAFTNIISGKNPRTAAGVDKTGKKLFLVAIDGRQSATPGMTQEELADYMIALGADSAINFDGGGSTTMVAREGESGTMQIVNLPSGGTPRAVATGIGVRYTGPAGQFSSLEVNKIGVTAVEGEAVHLYLGAYDENHNPVYIADQEITYTSEDGTFTGNIFYPSHAGTCKVTASCAGISGTLSFPVLSRAVDLEPLPQAHAEACLILPPKPAEKNCLDRLVGKRLSAMAADHWGKVIGYGAYAGAQEVKIYTESDFNGTKYLTLRVNGGIRQGESGAWEKLMQVCNAPQAKNVCILLSAPVSTFTDQAEAELFHRVLTENLHGNGAEVFVIEPGKAFAMAEKDGIRYITIPSDMTYHLRSFREDCKEKCGLKIQVRGDKICVEPVQLWEN
ncbi:MAG: phosphodiester glycosidase family protein [Clostridia bacterium]|nr:phosphodiester glycosidase family protein [Clostridia bacterium]